MNDNNYNYFYEERSNIPPKAPGGGQKVSFFTVVLIVLGTMLLCGASSYLGVILAQSKRQNAVVVYESRDAHPSELISNGEKKAVAGVVDATLDSVVEIATEQISYKDVFNQYVTAGAGSGVVWTENGYIVTNYHVVNDTQNITVTLTDGKSLGANVVGYDERTDLAVLKINATGLIPVAVGKSQDLLVGQDVVAIGNPLGSLGGTVTNGIISALGREITIDGEDMVLLQTNAAVNPGNSGGGLFNLYGELIGIVNAKSQGSGIEGLGFAIPSDTAKTVVADLIEYGYVRGRPKEDSIRVTEVVSGGLFTQSGLMVMSINTTQNIPLKARDYILKIDGVAVKTKKEWINVIRKHNAGDTVEIVYLRGSATGTFTLRLEENTEP